jgi:hypothetical protein
MIKTTNLALAFAFLSFGACTLPPIDHKPDLLSQSLEPRYLTNERGNLVPASCARDFSQNDQSGCQIDYVFALQVIRQDDLISPRDPGLPYSAYAARVAEEYIYGASQAIGVMNATNPPAEAAQVIPAEQATEAGQ